MRAKLVLGNWKMNGGVASAEALLAAVREGAAGLAGVQVGVCPPFPYLGLAAARLSGSRVTWGAQDVCEHDDGAFTGGVSARMLADLGCTHVLVGHSERRTLFGDTDEVVVRKAARVLAAGLVPVVCVGETRTERESGATEAVLARQVDAVCAMLAPAGERCVLAYEPVWAIGTGLTATPQQAQDAHAFIRSRLAAGGVAAAPRLQLLYGGSVKPSNAAELFSRPDVDGGLIGGASLVAADFLAILGAAAHRG
ncbi:MAG: triose-phosphate isomerase [Burkholderiaceae bacterium]|jgi:triosephosphate isomerase|nr:triose-phosphate isomerase [Burkholderiales bacterium]MCZ8107017.1 triose-phosphate isomerase [Burkholderiales bacterium]MCZ8336591.1 triose-phosphate isomerase [Burkholderiaceae bacterium]